jgi:hypothetical protein
MFSEQPISIHSLAFEIPYTPGPAGACDRIEIALNECATEFSNGMAHSV